MKILIFILFFCFCTSSVFAYSSKASKFAEQEYAKTSGCKKVQINMKKEYNDKYEHKTGKHHIRSITYGWGDMKTDKCRKKSKITYFVLYNDNDTPFWSSVNFYK